MLSKKKKVEIIGIISIYCGILVMGLFLRDLWTSIQRPPLRTLGETRLWYSAFIPVIGIITYHRWKYKWFIVMSLLMAMGFLTVNLLYPETHDQTLMPALQSYWFVPHVTVYLFAYSMLGVSAMVSGKGIYDAYRGKLKDDTLKLADNIVHLGVSFLTLGLLFGAMWAKRAWGHYWTWDPKETWAFLTWMSYLAYIHFRSSRPHLRKTAVTMLGCAFIILLLCWFGINYMPSAINSVHTYSKS